MSSEVTCYLDEPSSALIDGTEFRLRGWISVKPGCLRRLAIRSIHGPVRVSTCPRPDVSEVFPNREVLGFSATVRLADHLTAVVGSQLILYVMCDSGVVGGFQFRVTARAMSLAAHIEADC
ncbi:MAG TPA: hypothetical protein VGK29_10140 [Paludibaculum sp.]|jgi:hypothetical protein